MILLWLISFSLFASGYAAGATVSGKVELVGSQDASVRKQRNFSGVVVWLEPVGRKAPTFPHKVEMTQKDKTFRPHILPVTVGSSVSFPNFDPIFHNAFSNYSGQLFDVGLYPPGATRNVVFRRPGVVRVFCNIHASMSAVIVVLDTPYFTVSLRDGSFTIPNVPAGEYRIHAFHERATEQTLAALDKTITVDTADVGWPVLTISETGYVQTPHKNKFGKEYPPVEDSTYPGAKK